MKGSNTGRHYSNTGERSCSAVPTASAATAAAAALVLWRVCNCASFLLAVCSRHPPLTAVCCLLFFCVSSLVLLPYEQGGNGLALLRYAVPAADALVPSCVCNCAAFLSGCC